ncbi:MAG: chemotaxis protein CheA [Syntrophaceae bacterium]|nr:chemotaxis protein CheA [Syntrophaceae bacterium]
MDLNHLAISLIELNPENLPELEEFKKNLITVKKKSRGHLKDILEQVCAEVEAWKNQSLESRRAGMARLGELLEQAMEFKGKKRSGAKPKTPPPVQPETPPAVPPIVPPKRAGSLSFTLSTEFDADLLNEFIAESMDCLNMAESAILDWEKNPNNQELLNTIFRGFHTIKGTSSFININCIKDMAHHTESMLSKVRDGEEVFTRGHADLSLKSLDMIKAILEGMKSSGPGQHIELPLDTEGLHEELRNFMSGNRSQEVSNLSAEQTFKELPVQRLGEGLPDQPVAAHQTSDQIADATVRVKIDRLDKLLDTVGELVVAQTMVGQDELIVGGKNYELNKKISQAGKIVRELHDLSMFLRVVPLKGTFKKMVRLARDLSLKQGKIVSCITEGDDIEIDRNMVDLVADPLIHLIRNAVDHGIEMPEERRLLGKSETGHIYLTAGHAEGSIMLTVWDDGRGISRQAVVAKAIERGLLDSAELMTDQEILQMIFMPGFSTAEKVTEISGRGVGMDVVKDAVESIRGRIEVHSTEGNGCAFIMRLPLTLAITDGMIVKVGSQRYILPTANIHKAVRPEKGDIHTVNQRAEMILFRNELLPIIRLHRLFDIPDARNQLTSGLLVVIGEGQQRCALFVDELLSQTQVVTKLLGKGLDHVPGVAGGAIMGDGTVGLILDASGIINIARQ